MIEGEVYYSSVSKHFASVLRSIVKSLSLQFHYIIIQTLYSSVLVCSVLRSANCDNHVHSRLWLSDNDTCHSATRLPTPEEGGIAQQLNKEFPTFVSVLSLCCFFVFYFSKIIPCLVCHLC